MHNPTIEKCASLFQEASFFLNFFNNDEIHMDGDEFALRRNPRKFSGILPFRTFLSPDTLFYHICSYKVLKPVYNDSSKCTDMLHVWLPG